MSEPQANLRVRISGDLADIKQGLGLLRADLAKTAAAGAKAGKDWEAGFSGLTKKIVGLGAAFVSIRTLVDTFTSNIDQADKLNDLTLRFGLSAEAASDLGYAAKQTGTDVDALGTGFKRLSKNMSDALDPDSPQAKMFKALGIDVKDADGNLRSLESILPEIADVFKSIEDPVKEAALAQELFGKSGTDMLEFLNLGADGLANYADRARELGIELSHETLAGADQFNDTIVDLQAASQGLTTQLSAELLPILQDGLEFLIELTKDGDLASESIDSLRSIIDGAGATIEGTTQLMAAMSTVVEKLGGDSDIAKLKVSDLFRVMGDVGDLLGSFGQRIAGGVNELTGRITGDASLKARGVFQQREALRAGRRALYGLPEFDVSSKVSGTSIADFSSVEARTLTRADYQRQALESRLNKLLSTGSGSGKSDAERKAEQLRKELERLEEQTKKSLEKLREQEIEQEAALQRQLDDAETELLRATGKNAEASFRDIDARYKDLLAKLKANSNTEGVAIVEKLIDTQKLQARLADFQAKAQQILGNLQNTETSLSAQGQAGTLGFAEAESRIGAERAKSLQQLRDLRAAVEAYYTATKDPTVLAYLQELDGNIANVTSSQQKLRQQVADSAIDSVTDLFVDLTDSSKDAGQAIEDFAKNFVRSMIQIGARALATYLILQLLDAIYPGLGKATVATMGAGVKHGGGLVGGGGTRREGLSPLLFGAAPHYHNGGIAGFAPNERPTVLEVGEEILTKRDPRHRNNLGKGVAASGDIPIEVQVHKYGAGDGDVSTELLEENGKAIVKITLAEVARQAGLKGSKLNRAIATGLGNGVQRG